MFESQHYTHIKFKQNKSHTNTAKTCTT